MSRQEGLGTHFREEVRKPELDHSWISSPGDRELKSTGGKKSVRQKETRIMNLVWDMPIFRYVWTIHKDRVQMTRVEFCLLQVRAAIERLRGR